MKEMMKSRGARPLFIIDNAVPRNIDPEIARMDGVFLYNIDDLKSIADENMKSRLNEAALAEKIVESDVREFMGWCRGLAAVPAISRIQDRFEEIRVSELERYRKKKLKHLSDEDFKIIEDLTTQIMTRTLHNPITHLKQYAAPGRGHGDGQSVEDAIKMILEMFDR
jgi:glutamyl-tRNA reductase